MRPGIVSRSATDEYATIPPFGESLALLREQDSLYARLEELASRQRLLIRRDDPSPLLTVLADRQRLATQLLQIAERLEPVRRSWPDYRAGLSAAEQQEADCLVGRTQARLRRMLEGDENDARWLAARKQTVSDRLRSIHNTGEAIQAYRVPTAQASRLDCREADSTAPNRRLDVTDQGAP